MKSKWLSRMGGPGGLAEKEGREWGIGDAFWKLRALAGFEAANNAI